jgi:transcriptional regulator with XRE-family HTH domain
MNIATDSVRRAAPPAFGEHLRQWRQRRRLSQFELAQEAEISPRHLSFVETGRSLPSRLMVIRLADRLNVPLRERNALLVAAGYAPMYRERALDDPALAAARQAVELILKSHEPCPSLAVDRHWNLVLANRMVRLRQQIEATGDGTLAALLQELRAYPAPKGDATHLEGELLGVAMPFRFQTEQGVLSFISTTTIFGTPADVTLQELALETFFPADAQTAAALRRRMPAE